MDSEGSNVAQEKAPMEHLWIAPVIVGVILFLMVAAIVVIVLWKCKKKSGNVDPNWAGPSPYATGDFPDAMTFNMKESSSPTRLSVTEINTITVISDQPQKEWEAVAQTNIKVNTNTPLPPTLMEEVIQPPNVITASTSPDEDFPPPPPNSFIECSVSSEKQANQAMDESHQQHNPLSWSEYEGDNTQRSLHKQLTPNSEMVSTYNIDDQQLPPPPPELLTVT